MKRLLAVVWLLGLGALVAAARPGTEQQLVQQLNGQPTRWVMPDGGASGVFTGYDAGVLNSSGCMPLFGARAVIGGSLQSVVPNVLMYVALTPSNVCMRPAVNSTYWDGGCNATPTDENFGVPVPAGVPQYETPDSLASSSGWLCAVSDAGYVQIPVWWAQ